MAITFDTVQGNQKSLDVLSQINSNFTKIANGSVANADNALKLNNKEAANYVPCASEMKDSITTLTGLDVGRYFCQQVKADWEPLATQSASSTRLFMLEVSKTTIGGSSNMYEYAVTYLYGEGTGSKYFSYYDSTGVLKWKKSGEADTGIFFVDFELDELEEINEFGETVYNVSANKTVAQIAQAYDNGDLVLGRMFIDNLNIYIFQLIILVDFGLCFTWKRETGLTMSIGIHDVNEFDTVNIIMSSNTSEAYFSNSDSIYPINFTLGAAQDTNTSFKKYSVTTSMSNTNIYGLYKNYSNIHSYALIKIDNIYYKLPLIAATSSRAIFQTKLIQSFYSYIATIILNSGTGTLTMALTNNEPFLITFSNLSSSTPTCSATYEQIMEVFSTYAGLMEISIYSEATATFTSNIGIDAEGRLVFEGTFLDLGTYYDIKFTIDSDDVVTYSKTPSSNEFFHLYFYYESGNYHCNKTYSEIATAITNNIPIVGNIEGGAITSIYTDDSDNIICYCEVRWDNEKTIVKCSLTENNVVTIDWFYEQSNIVVAFQKNESNQWEEYSEYGYNTLVAALSNENDNTPSLILGSVIGTNQFLTCTPPSETGKPFIFSCLTFDATSSSFTPFVLQLTSEDSVSELSYNSYVGLDFDVYFGTNTTTSQLECSHTNSEIYNATVASAFRIKAIDTDIPCSLTVKSITETKAIFTGTYLDSNDNFILEKIVLEYDSTTETSTATRTTKTITTT